MLINQPKKWTSSGVIGVGVFATLNSVFTKTVPSMAYYPISCTNNAINYDAKKNIDFSFILFVWNDVISLSFLQAW